jgi:hypothetical protein
MKEEFKPLLEPGFHDLNFEDLEVRFVKPFNSSTSRKTVMGEFSNWVNKFKELGLKAEIWINGSFLTEKINPKDIDVVVFINSKEIRELSAENKVKLSVLTNEKLTDEERKICICDTYLEFAEDPFGRKYWENKVFGISLKKVPKGIVRIFI